MDESIQAAQKQDLRIVDEVGRSLTSCLEYQGVLSSLNNIWYVPFELEEPHGENPVLGLLLVLVGTRTDSLRDLGNKT
ncbi:MAG: hypothetical protein HY672_01705 [Chloroflexi bacterium]|nr:hypothetical protein [Chloroflexota bacterium]